MHAASEISTDISLSWIQLSLYLASDVSLVRQQKQTGLKISATPTTKALQNKSYQQKPRI